MQPQLALNLTKRLEEGKAPKRMTKGITVLCQRYSCEQLVSYTMSPSCMEVTNRYTRRQNIQIPKRPKSKMHAGERQKIQDLLCIDKMILEEEKNRRNLSMAKVNNCKAYDTWILECLEALKVSHNARNQLETMVSWRVEMMYRDGY